MVEVKMKNIQTIKPYWRNPRKNEKAVEALKKSIIKFGFNVPIVVDKNDVIIAGHSRYLAVNDLIGKLDFEIEKIRSAPDLKANLENINKGIVPTITLKDLSESQAKEYRITDNKISDLSEWDYENLKFEIRELGTVVGFDSDEINNLLELSANVMKTELLDDNTIEQKKIELEESVLGYDIETVEVTCPHCQRSFTLDKRDVTI